MRSRDEIEVSTMISNGHLRLSELVLKRGEVPGQQLGDAVDRVIGNPLQDLAQIEFRIKSVELGCPQ